MSDDQLLMEPVIQPPLVVGDEAGALVTTALALPRAPRTSPGNRSYCPETAWVWQRARLVCAVKDSNG